MYHFTQLFSIPFCSISILYSFQHSSLTFVLLIQDDQKIFLFNRDILDPKNSNNLRSISSLNENITMRPPITGKKTSSITLLLLCYHYYSEKLSSREELNSMNISSVWIIIPNILKGSFKCFRRIWCLYQFFPNESLTRTGKASSHYALINFMIIINFEMYTYL